MVVRGTTAEFGKNSKWWEVEFEEQFWAAVEKLRGPRESGDDMYLVFGLVFLKYLSDAFAHRYAELLRLAADPNSSFYTHDTADLYALLENRQAYTAERICWVPARARWSFLRWNSKHPDIGTIIDEAMAALEMENPGLHNVLPRGYARSGMDKQRLAELMILISGIGISEVKAEEILGGGVDVFARVFQFLLDKFTAVEGKNVLAFVTPPWLLRLLLEMPALRGGSVYDPCCGLGSSLIAAQRCMPAQGSEPGELSLYGQEMNVNNWRLCRMHLAVRGLTANIAVGDTLRHDHHPHFKADVIVANPPLNLNEWGVERGNDDVRWSFGVPPPNNADFAWLQHIVHHLALGGMAGVALARRSLSANQSGEGAIRRALVEADLVDCIVALPGRLSSAPAVPLCLWFLTRGKGGGTSRGRRGETLFIDARKLHARSEPIHRELCAAEIDRIIALYQAWRGDDLSGAYADIPGLCNKRQPGGYAPAWLRVDPGPLLP